MSSLESTSDKPGIATAWVTGVDACASLHSQTPEERADELAGALAKYAPGVHVIGAVAATSWTKNPLYLGSYSFRKIGRGNSGVASALRAPITDSASRIRIAFAGEAMSPTHFGTTHGAWLDGVRAARAILQSTQYASELNRGLQPTEGTTVRRRMSLRSRLELE